MNKTNDFKYNLPAYSDPVDIEDLNDNFRGIDDALMAGLCKKDYTGNNMGSSDPSARKYAWAPWFEIVNDNEFDVVVTDRNAPVESEEATINIAAGQTFRKYINGRYYMNFYVQDQYDVTFKWFTNAETYINESGGGGGGTGTVTSVSVQGGSGSHLTGSGNPIETSGTITINVDEGYSIPSDNEQTAWDSKAADLKFEINSSTFVITAQLKDASGNLIGNERTIDLPLESVVVSGDYDEQTKKVILTLQNGSTIDFSVADLVSGLQTELNSNNKLNPDYIAYDASHRAVSDTEKGTWDAKQNAISDLETIRSGAAAGATAVQPSAMQTALSTKQDSLDNTQLAAVNSGINSTKVAQISTNQTNILYGLNTCVKNLLIIKSTFTNNGLTSVQQPDGYTVKITGTPTGGKSIAWSEVIKITESGTYKIKLTLSGTGASCYLYDVTTSTTVREYYSSNTYDATLTANHEYAMYTYSTTAVDATISAMICTEAAYAQSPDYMPPTLPNSDLTRLEAEDRASLAEVVDSGAKNIVRLVTPYGPGLANNPNLSVTVDKSTGIVTVSGSTTASGLIYISEEMSNIKGYVLSGKQQLTEDYYHQVYTVVGASGMGNDRGNGAIISDNAVCRDCIFVFAGKTINATIKPMICTLADWKVSQRYVPYRPNWDFVYNIAKSGGFMDASHGSFVQNADLNAISESCVRLYHSPSNSPTTATYILVKTYMLDSTTGMQEATAFASPVKSYTRVKMASTWGSWVETTNA